jgi:hypothetical protein
VPAMKPSHLLAGVATFLVAIMAWYVQSGGSETVPKRPTNTLSGIAEASGAMEVSGFATGSTIPADGPRSERDLEKELEDANARIDELTKTVDQLTAAWNQFASQEEEKRKRASMRGWSPEQATGAPDSKGAGDQQTAWASLQPDGGAEWLETAYATAVQIAGVRVFENDKPGAIVKITALADGGAEVVLWEGVEPAATAPAEQYFAARGGVFASRIRIHMDTAKVAGWNEVDAVELIGMDGTRQWAQSASASSTYASPRGGGIETTVFRSVRKR